MEQLTLDSLRNTGGFVGGPVKKDIIWTNDEGQEFSAFVYVRRMTYVQMLEGQDQTLEQRLFSRIAKYICGEDGAPLFTIEQISGIKEDGTPVTTGKGKARREVGAFHPSLIQALVKAISEVSGLGKMQAAESLEQKSDSGTD